jgi:hypothetical protein
MCSKADAQEPRTGNVAARLAKAIDELAAAASAGDAADGPELAARLADAWAEITAADPELAARTARYSRS